MRYFLVFVFLVSAFIYACEEIQDPANQVSPPLISIDFQADSTRLLVEKQVDVADSIVDTLFLVYNDLIGREEFEDTAKAGMAYREALQEFDSLDDVFTLLKSNRVLLDSVYALHESSNVIADTINSVFDLPLDMNATHSAYVFSYFKNIDTLAFTYQTRTEAGIEKINVIAFDIKLDSVKTTFERYSRLYCNNPNCTSGEIVYQVFF